MSLSVASITPTKIGPDGIGKLTDLVAASAQACQSGGDAFACQGKEVVVLNNASGGTLTVTFKAVADNFGNVLSGNDLTLAIPAGKQGIIGPFSAAKYADANGLVQMTYSGVTTLTMGLFTFSVTS